MTTTLEEMNCRIEIAERVEREALRGTQGGLRVSRIDDYIVIDDGTDRWVASTEDYDEAVEEVVSDILEGDLCLDSDVNEHDVEWYTALCNACDYIHSNCGRSDLQAVAELEVAGKSHDAQQAVYRELFDALGETYDVRSVHPNGCSCGSPDCPEWIDAQEVTL